MEAKSNQFISGVIEGFYGQPWTMPERRQLIRWLHAWGMNSYLYAPKDDLKHRAMWRSLYGKSEIDELGKLVQECRSGRIRFGYGIAPGLDIQYSKPSELAALKSKLAQLIKLGVRSFAILFDDIPQRMTAKDARRFPTFANAQCAVTNAAFDFLQAEASGSRLWFCPTIYCDQMAGGNAADSDYLREIGERLHRAIDIFWTGPAIVSRAIPVEACLKLQQVIRRKPLIWDNLHANDYDMRRRYMGPYSGRPLELRRHVTGILSNPNCEFSVNYAPLRTLAMYLQADSKWHPRKAYKQALAEWLAFFSCPTKTRISAGDLELLGDLFYLPHEHGARAIRWLNDCARLLTTKPDRWGQVYKRFVRDCRNIAGLFAKLTELTDRSLCYALYRHLWEIKEEVALLSGYVNWLKTRPKGMRTFCSADHQPGVYRGGVAATVQRLLPMTGAGCFSHKFEKPF